MRFLGLLLAVAGAAATAACVTASLSSRRPRDVGFAVLAPLALAVTLCGAVLLFVPDFFA